MKPARVLPVLCLVMAWMPSYAEGLDLARLDGTWQSEGYGRIYEIAADTVHVVNITAISGVLHQSIARADFLALINRINLTNVDRFSYYHEGGITRYEYRRIAGVPARCAVARDAGPDFNPELNFNVFWHSFNRHPGGYCAAAAGRSNVR